MSLMVSSKGMQVGSLQRQVAFLAFDLDIWPSTLTYNPNLAKVKVDPHTKNQGQTVQTGEVIHTQLRGR